MNSLTLLWVEIRRGLFSIVAYTEQGLNKSISLVFWTWLLMERPLDRLFRASFSISLLHLLFLCFPHSMIYWKPKRILEWTLVIHSFFCCWLHSQRSKPGISLVALTTCNAVSRSYLQDHSNLAYQHWFFPTAQYTASSPAGMAPSTAPHRSILAPCLFLKIPVENVLSPLLTTESKCVNSWSPHLNLIFSLTPLWSHMDYSIKQLSLPSLNVCNFSFSQCQRFGFNPILPCTLINFSFHCPYIPHQIYLLLWQGHQIFCLFCVSQEPETVPVA